MQLKIKITATNNLFMVGGFSGLTSKTSRPLSCGSDTPDCRQVTVTVHYEKRQKTHLKIGYI
jgi:hypothetical protein